MMEEIMRICCCTNKKVKDEGFMKLGQAKSSALHHPKGGESTKEEEERLVKRGGGERRTKDAGILDGDEKTISLQDKVDSDEVEEEKDIDNIEEAGILQIIKQSNIDALLSEVQTTLKSLEPIAPLQRITKPTDLLELYFAVLDSSDGKEKAHKFLSFYEVEYDPKYFVLRNSLLSADERLKSNPNLQSYTTIARRKIGNTYYMVNHAVFKKVMLMSQRESLMIKAFRFLDNGDCIEHNMSVEYPSIPEHKSVVRINTLSNPIYYQKTEKGLKAKSFNYVLPKTSIGFTILKPILGSSYTNTFTSILKIIKEEPIGTADDLARLF